MRAPLLSGTRLVGWWDNLQTSFWFVPSLMAAGAAFCSVAVVQLDVWLGVERVREFSWIYSFGPEGARAILSAIAGSMITVAGLSFSITMLTLQLASSQFGPRLLRNFMRDRGNQVVLGTFLATFIYCLLTLRTVRGTEDASFVPHLAVALGTGLAIASLAVLIYFIHHVATSIRIETVLSKLAAEASDAVDRLYPEQLGEPPPQPASGTDQVPQDLEHRSRPVLMKSSGYVQRVDEKALMRIAEERDLLVCVKARPGSFVTESDPVLLAYPSGHVTDDISDELRGVLIVGQERTPNQDLEFSIRRIVEVAQRSLSPGINDPTTALYCIDRLGQVLERLARRPTPSSVRFDEAGRLRVLTEVHGLPDLACPAIAAIARYALSDDDVVQHLLETMGKVARASAEGEGDKIVALAAEIRRSAQEKVRLATEQSALTV